MRNEHGQRFEDAIAVSFNEGFERLLKWVTVGPLLALTAVVASTAAWRGHSPLLPE